METGAERFQHLRKDVVLKQNGKPFVAASGPQDLFIRVQCKTTRFRKQEGDCIPVELYGVVRIGFEMKSLDRGAVRISEESSGGGFGEIINRHRELLRAVLMSGIGKDFFRFPPGRLC